MEGQFCFYLKTAESPTAYNLSRYLQKQGWRSTSVSAEADFGEDNFQFDLEAAEQLEYKHLLAQLVGEYCPEIMPLTYCINDYNWPQVLNQIAVNNQRKALIWILKPALLNNGQGIKIFQTLTEIEGHFLSSQRFGGEHVLQQYIDCPDLLRAKHKYSIRIFVVLSNYAGSFLYPFGYYNVALHPFKANDFNDQRPHLTNEHLQTNETNVVQIPSQRFAVFSSIYPQIKTTLSTVIKALKTEYPQAFICNKKRALAIFGFDFLVDKNGRLWLLEANHGPCFPIEEEHPLQQHLYSDFWQHFIASFVLPIAKNSEKNSLYHPFELLPC